MEEDEGDAADHAAKMESFTIQRMQEDYLMVNNNRTGPAPVPDSSDSEGCKPVKNPSLFYSRC
jgi:hypothetical protein